jgi:hypothetical protein
MFLASQFTVREFVGDMACKGNADMVDRPLRRAMLIIMRLSPPYFNIEQGLLDPLCAIVLP